jgi:polyhydroxybutyrate depolymerase
MVDATFNRARVALVAVLAIAVLPFALMGLRAAGGTAAGSQPAVKPAPTRACGTAAAAGPGGFGVAFASGGRQRSALVHVPALAAGRPAPLLLGFHGSGGNGPFMKRYSGLSRVAGTAGFVAVYPTAAGPRWNLEESEDPSRADDVRFVRELIDRLGGQVCFDKTRVYAAGVSNGGGFAGLLACRLNNRIAGVAAVAGGYGDLPACEPARPLSVLEIHGTDDQVVPYGGRDGRGAARQFAADWAARDGCPDEPVRSRMASRTLRFDWGPCAGGAAVAHIKVIGGAHAWPGAVPPDPGPPSAIDAAPVIWQFLAPHRLAAAR